MRRIELFRTTAFRWTLGIAGILAFSILLMSGFFYWQTVGYIRMQIDGGLLSDAQKFANEGQGELIRRLGEALQSDPHRRKAYGLFAPDGTALAGNVPAEPNPLPAPGAVVETTVMLNRQNRVEPITVRAAAERLPDGSVLFLGRAADQLQEIKEIVTRAMLLAVMPTVVLALAGGALVSTGTLRRVDAVRRACQMIMEGHLDRRLPVRARKDEFDRLSEIVNRMLDDIERLITEAKGAGDAIAHEVRTPLTRLRVRLERALKAPGAGAPVPELFEKSIADIDQLLSTITAILRIAEVEQSRRKSGFGAVDLDDIVSSVGELYTPIAEEKALAFTIERQAVPNVPGDGDLMFEAVANLVDNAVKFNPSGGRVGVLLAQSSQGPLVTVRDTGPGIAPEERDAVLRRFYRADRSRSLPGTGLGLSLVAAIVRLHGFELTLAEAPGGGCEATILCKALDVVPETAVAPARDDRTGPTVQPLRA